MFPAEHLMAILIGLGTSLVVLAIGMLLSERVPKSVALILAVGVGLIVAVVRPRTPLTNVPDLTGMSRGEKRDVVKLV